MLAGVAEGLDMKNDTSVFIVGGGPVGLAMALLLDRFGIDCIVAEKDPTTTEHPKSRGCLPRTMELFRQWGIEDAIRARGLQDNSGVFSFVDSIAGHEYGRTRLVPTLGHTPASGCMVAQDAIEEELLRVVEKSAHARVLFSTEAVSFAESTEGVTVRTRSLADGNEQEWRARYLVAADGAGSQIRRDTGIEMVGPSLLAVVANEYWRGDLSPIPAARNTGAFFITPKDPASRPSTILNTNGRDRWLSLFAISPDEKYDERRDADVIQFIRKQTGIPDLAVELINHTTWRMTRQVASEFRRGRVFLAGDAAHRFPPTGGFGLNSGVQDAHNLAWKIAFVVRGWASERLLDSYSVERKPVAESNADFSLQNSVRLPLVTQAIRAGNPDQIAFRINDMDNHLHSIGQGLGFVYERGAVIPDGTAPVPFSSRYYTPSDRPGSRFPHQWVDLARHHSTLDWFDREFTVVAGPMGGEWLEAGRKVSKQMSLPLNLQTLPNPNPNDGILMGLRGAVLVRPDGHVAWRMPWLSSDPACELAAALTALLR
jgi:2-polyprenyl-6-methoxyphenol hydroxylase-like FAD-dependent oxidoreductase